MKLLLSFIFLFVFPSYAFAEVNSGDTAWILTSTALVLLMTLPGLALFYTGLVQSRNAVSVLMHHFAVACLASILWVVICYTSAFSGTGLADEMSVNSQFLAQLFGVVLTVVWTLSFTFVALKITSFFTSLRVEEQEEIEGLDLRSHGERAYYND